MLAGKLAVATAGPHAKWIVLEICIKCSSSFRQVLPITLLYCSTPLCWSQAIKPDLSNFEESESAWPYLFDEFVETLREERKKQSESVIVVDDD